MDKSIVVVKKLIFNNFYWKLFSLFMASVLWLVVMSINNPVETKTYSVYLKLENKDALSNKGIVVLNENELEKTRVDIKVKSTRPALEEISKNVEARLLASINLKDFDLLYSKNFSEIISKNIEIELNQNEHNNYEIVNYSPKKVNMKLDEKVTETKPLVAEFVGNVKSGYVASKPELSISNIDVKGARTIVDSIKNVVLKVDVTGKSASIKENVTPVALDFSGNEVQDVTFLTNSVSLSVAINLQGAIKILEPVVTGNLPNDYVVRGIEYSPSSIEVVGSTKDIENLREIQLPSIDLDRITSTKKYSYDIEQFLNGTGLRVKNGTTSHITVNVIVGKLTEKQIEIPASKLTILGYNDKQDIDMGEELIKFKVKGFENVVNSLNVDNLKPTLSLSNLNVGAHSLEVYVTLPADVEITSKPYIQIQISNKDLEKQIEKEEETITTTEVITENTNEVFEEVTSLTEEITERVTEKITEEIIEETTSKKG